MEDNNYLRSLVIETKDFPKDGILFRDISGILIEPRGIRMVVDDICRKLYCDSNNFDVVIGLDARGFIIGSVLSYEMDKGFIMARKPNKLPPPIIEEKYDLEYGTNTISILDKIIKKGTRVHIHDDLLATGGTAEATIKLIQKLGGIVDSISFVVELTELNGRSTLSQYIDDENIFSVLKY